MYKVKNTDRPCGNNTRQCVLNNKSIFSKDYIIHNNQNFGLVYKIHFVLPVTLSYFIN